MKYPRVAAALVLTLFALGCADTHTEDESVVQDTAAAAPAAAPAGPSDAEIAHIVVTANTIDIEAGEAARSKASAAEVKQFAEQMIKDHTAVNDQASQLAQRLNLTPADNATSQSLQSGAEQAKTDLSAKSGADYDRAYIDHEVAYHQQVLDALDNTLIPGAQNADLKALLQQTRPAIAAHLQMAKDIQGKLGQ